MTPPVSLPSVSIPLGGTAPLGAPAPHVAPPSPAPTGHQQRLAAPGAGREGLRGVAAERDPPAGAARPPGREVPAEGLHPRGLDRWYSPPCSRPPFLALRHTHVLTHTCRHLHTHSPCCLCRLCLFLRLPFLLPRNTRVTNDALGASSPGQQGTAWGQVSPGCSGLEITHRWAPSWVI